MKISVIICCFDEELIIKKSWDKLNDALKLFPDDEFEIIFINDGSTDNTLKLLNELKNTNPSVRIASYEKNQGYGFALNLGIKNTTGDIIITCDCDMAMPPEQVIGVCRENLEKYDAVICSRYKGIKPDYPLMKRIFSWGYRKLNKMLFKIPFEDTQSGFIGFKKEILKGIELKSTDFSASMELIVKAYENKWQITEIPVKWVHDTTSGETSFLKAGPKMFMNSMRIWKEITHNKNKKLIL